MKRTTPLKRTGFARKAPPRPAGRQWTGHTPDMAPAAASLRRDDGKARMTVAVPKFHYVRSKALLEAYRQLPCQYDRDGGGLCAKMDGTVCCNHSNWSIHGKGRSVKASDDRGASGCHECHAELDQGTRWTEPEKRRRWWAAHVRSVRLLVQLGLWPAGVPVPDTSTPPEGWTEGAKR